MNYRATWALKECWLVRLWCSINTSRIGQTEPEFNEFPVNLQYRLQAVFLSASALQWENDLYVFRFCSRGSVLWVFSVCLRWRHVTAIKMNFDLQSILGKMGRGFILRNVENKLFENKINWIPLIILIKHEGKKKKSEVVFSSDIPWIPQLTWFWSWELFSHYIH